MSARFLSFLVLLLIHHPSSLASNDSPSPCSAYPTNDSAVEHFKKPTKELLQNQGKSLRGSQAQRLEDFLRIQEIILFACNPNMDFETMANPELYRFMDDLGLGKYRGPLYRPPEITRGLGEEEAAKALEKQARINYYDRELTLSLITLVKTETASKHLAAFFNKEKNGRPANIDMTHFLQKLRDSKMGLTNASLLALTNFAVTMGGQAKYMTVHKLVPLVSDIVLDSVKPNVGDSNSMVKSLIAFFEGLESREEFKRDMYIRKLAKHLLDHFKTHTIPKPQRATLPKASPKENIEETQRSKSSSPRSSPKDDKPSKDIQKVSDANPIYLKNTNGPKDDKPSKDIQTVSDANPIYSKDTNVPKDISNHSENPEAVDNLLEDYFHDAREKLSRKHSKRSVSFDPRLNFKGSNERTEKLSVHRNGANDMVSGKFVPFIFLILFAFLLK